jgi:hypothetical protein
MVLVLAIAATAALLILALVYYSGSSARIASDYTTIAAPANRALSAELARYTSTSSRDLASARSDLMREAKTLGSFDDQLAEVTFPAAAATAADALIQADTKLAKLIERQAQAPSPRKMRSFDPRLEADVAIVKIEVRRIREALGLPQSGGPLY